MTNFGFLLTAIFLLLIALSSSTLTTIAPFPNSILIPGQLVLFQFETDTTVSMNDLVTVAMPEGVPFTTRFLSGQGALGNYCSISGDIKAATFTFNTFSIDIIFLRSLPQNTLISCTFRFSSNPSSNIQIEINNVNYLIDLTPTIDIQVQNTTPLDNTQKPINVKFKVSQIAKNTLVGPFDFGYKFNSGNTISFFDTDTTRLRFMRQFLVSNYDPILGQDVRFILDNDYNLYIMTDESPVEVIFTLKYPHYIFLLPNEVEYEQNFSAYVAITNVVGETIRSEYVVASLPVYIAPNPPNNEPLPISINNLTPPSLDSNDPTSVKFLFKILSNPSVASNTHYDIYVQLKYDITGDIRMASTHYPTCVVISEENADFSVIVGPTPLIDDVHSDRITLRLKGVLSTDLFHQIECRQSINEGLKSSTLFDIHLKYGSYFNFVYNNYDVNSFQTSHAIMTWATIPTSYFNQLIIINGSPINSSTDFITILSRILTGINSLYNDELTVDHFHYSLDHTQSFSDDSLGSLFEFHSSTIKSCSQLGSQLVFVFNSPVGTFPITYGPSLQGYGNNALEISIESGTFTGLDVSAIFLDGSIPSIYDSTQAIIHGSGVKCSTTQQCTTGMYCQNNSCTNSNHLHSSFFISHEPFDGDLDTTCLFPINEDNNLLWNNDCQNGGECRLNDDLDPTNTNEDVPFICFCANGFGEDRCQTLIKCLQCNFSHYQSCGNTDECICDGGWISNCFEPEPPSVFGIPLAPSAFNTPGITLSITKLASLQELPTNPPANISTLFQSTTLNILTAAIMRELSRNTIQISYYYFLNENIANPTLFYQTNANKIENDIVTIVPSSSFPLDLIFNSILFVVIHYVSKPAAFDDNDNETSSFFLSDYFRIQPATCFSPPIDFSQMGNQAQWISSCGENGECRHDTTLNNESYICVCKNSFSGVQCQIEPCSNCMHKNSCQTTDTFENDPEYTFGTCLCQNGYEGSNCSIPIAPSVSAFPLAPNTPLTEINVFPFNTDPISSVIQPSVIPTIKVPNLSLNIDYGTISITSSTRDTVQMIYYYFPNALSSVPIPITSISAPQILQKIIPFSTLSLLPNDLTASSVIFAIIHHITKPLGDDDELDENQWVHTYFLTNFFTLHTKSCFTPPADFSDVYRTDMWSTTCSINGDCQLDNNEQYQCHCKNSFSGDECDIIPCNDCIHKKKCHISDGIYDNEQNSIIGGNCECLDSWNGKNCNIFSPMTFLRFNNNDDNQGEIQAVINISEDVRNLFLNQFRSHTVYFRIGLYSFPDSIDDNLGFPLDFNADKNTLAWLSAQFTIYPYQAALVPNTAPQTVVSYVIPDFISNQDIIIKIPSIFGQRLSNPHIFVEPINIPQNLIPTYRFQVAIGDELIHRCPVDPSHPNTCSWCSTPWTTNWFSDSGCDDFTRVGQYSACPHLTCPVYMDVDLSSCSCVCITQQCKDRTRSTMLYVQYPSIPPQTTHGFSKFGKSFFYNQLTAEITSILGLNTLPLSTANTFHRGGYIDDENSPIQSTILISPSHAYVAPIGYEELLISPITYTTLDISSMIVTITMTPFNSIQSFSSLQQVQMSARYNYLTSKLLILFTPSILSQFPFFTADGTNRSDFTINSTSNVPHNSFQWVNYHSTTSVKPSQLTTLCKDPISNIISTCPNVLQLKTSSYWSDCEVQQDDQHDISPNQFIYPICIDLLGHQILYDSNSSSWCGMNILYPDFPKQTVVASCQHQIIYDSPSLSSLSLMFSESSISDHNVHLYGGDIVSLAWQSKGTPNPSDTFSLYLGITQDTAAFDHFDSNYSINSNPISDLNTKMMQDNSSSHIENYNQTFAIQQSIEKGYSVLLDTFSIQSNEASVKIPNLYIKSTLPLKITIFARLHQVSSEPIISSNNQNVSSVYYASRTRCSVDYTCPIHSQCEPATGACLCASLYRSVLDQVTLVPSCVSLCHDTCYSKGGVCNELTGTCTCKHGFEGLRCEIALNCKAQNHSLCSDNGFVDIINNKCTSTCQCYTNWTSPDADEDVDADADDADKNTNTQCTQCQLTRFSQTSESSQPLPPTCFQIGTHIFETENQGCTQCICHLGFNGEYCTHRVMYGTVQFVLPSYDGVPHHSAPMELSSDVILILIRDLSLSMGVSEDQISIAQVLISTHTSKLSKTSLISSSLNLSKKLQLSNSFGSFESVLQADDQTSTVLVTFAISTKNTHVGDDVMNETMRSLYDAWNNIQNNLNELPISQTEAEPEVGQPIGADDAYDPVCVSSPQATCPTGFNPFHDDGDDNNIATNSEKAISATIVIIIALIVAVLLFVFFGLLIFCSKKHNKLCFTNYIKTRNRTSNDDAHLELSSPSPSEASNARNTSTLGDLLVAPRLKRKSTVTSDTALTPRTTYSSGNATSIDLVECTGVGECEDLPEPWKKMKHVKTNEILYINNQLMISQKHSPLDPEPSTESFVWNDDDVM